MPVNKAGLRRGVGQRTKMRTSLHIALWLPPAPASGWKLLPDSLPPIKVSSFIKTVPIWAKKKMISSIFLEGLFSRKQEAYQTPMKANHLLLYFCRLFSEAQRILLRRGSDPTCEEQCAVTDHHLEHRAAALPDVTCRTQTCNGAEWQSCLLCHRDWALLWTYLWWKNYIWELLHQPLTGSRCWGGNHEGSVGFPIPCRCCDPKHLSSVPWWWD